MEPLSPGYCHCELFHVLFCIMLSLTSGIQKVLNIYLLIQRCVETPNGYTVWILEIAHLQEKRGKKTQNQLIVTKYYTQDSQSITFIVWYNLV